MAMEEGTAKAMAQVSKEAKGTEEYFPPEIFFEIVSRLPSKSVGRFATVSKSWYAFIKSSAFIAAHLKQSIANNKGDNSSHYLLYVDSRAKDCYAYRDNTESFDELFSLKLPMDFESGTCRFVGSCNGLVCLTDDKSGFHGRVLYVWNPVIRKYKCITGTSCCCTVFYSKDTFVSVGFWYDDGKHDYKLIRILHNARDDSSEFTNQSQVELYSLNIGSWRKIDAKLPRRIQPCLNATFLNGTFNWIAYSPRASGTTGDSEFILSFDTSAEQFRKVQLPKYKEDHYQEWDNHLGVYKGCLAFFAEVYSSAHRCPVWSVWVMNEFGVVESWVNKFNVETEPEDGRHYELYYPLGITENNEIIFCTDATTMAYNLQMGTIRYLPNDGCVYSSWLGHTESLVFLDEENELFGISSSS